MKSKRKIPLKELERLQEAHDHLKSIIGELKGCAVPFSDESRQAHYIRSWVIPKLEKVIQYAKGSTHEPPLSTQQNQVPHP